MTSLTSFPILDLTSDHPIIQEIYELGLKAKPAEACGVILPTPFNGSQVVEVENWALDTESHFYTTGKAIAEAIHEWLLTATHQETMDIIFWHTHPKGGIGPSRIDLRERVFGGHHLVVSLTEDGPCPVIY